MWNLKTTTMNLQPRESKIETSHPVARIGCGGWIDQEIFQFTSILHITHIFHPRSTNPFDASERESFDPCLINFLSTTSVSPQQRSHYTHIMHDHGRIAILFLFTTLTLPLLTANDGTTTLDKRTGQGWIAFNATDCPGESKAPGAQVTAGKCHYYVSSTKKISDDIAPLEVFGGRNDVTFSRDFTRAADLMEGGSICLDC